MEYIELITGYSFIVGTLLYMYIDGFVCSLMMKMVGKGFCSQYVVDLFIYFYLVILF
jgi:hypothetical protein